MAASRTCLKMARSCVFLMLVMIAAVANAAALVTLSTGQDKPGARDECLRRNDIQKRQIMLERLERRLLEDVKTREDVIAKFGAPKPLNSDDVVRPLGASWIVALENVRRNGVENLMDRQLYFELKDVGGLLVFFSPEGDRYLPGFLFWKIDNQLPKMTDVTQCDKRLEWEAPRLRVVLDIVGVDEKTLTPNDAEMKANQEAGERILRFIDQLGRTKK